MLNLKLQAKSLVYPFKHLETGQKIIRLSLSQALVEEDCIIQNQSHLNNQKILLPNTFTVESHAQNKKMILKDKFLSSKINIKNIPSSLTLQVESTSKEKVFRGFWTRQSKEISEKLWLPTKTGYVGSRGITSTGCFLDSESLSSLRIEKNILLNQNSKMIFSPLSMFSLVDTTVKGGTTLIKEFQKTNQKTNQRIENMKNAKENKKNGTNKKPENSQPKDCFIPSSRTIKLNPTKKQIKIINDWIASTRKVWNVCLHEISKNKADKIREFDLRDKFIIKKQMNEEIKKQMEWTFRTPKRIREYAVKDILSCFKSGETRVKKKQIKKFIINNKKKKEHKQSISLPKEGSKIIDNNLKVCSLNIKISGLVQSQEITSNMRLSRIGINYYVHIPSFVKEREIKKESNIGLVGIDPGINIPFTYFSPQGEYGFIGMKLRKFLEKKYKKIESIKNNIVNKCRVKRLVKKHENQIIGVVNDFHWKTIHWLLKKYNKIVIPSLYVRKCNSHIKKIQNDMRHCDFVNRLVYKSIEYENVEIHHCKEHYTSMTCTNCGSLKTVKNKIVRCLSCKFEIHRDLSGARNMIIKHLCKKQ